MSESSLFGLVIIILMARAMPRWLAFVIALILIVAYKGSSK